MTLTISIPPTVEDRLRQKAQAAGIDLENFVSKLLEEAAGKLRIKEMLLPLRKQFEESGTSDDELLNEISGARKAYRDVKRKGMR